MKNQHKFLLLICLGFFPFLLVARNSDYRIPHNEMKLKPLYETECIKTKLDKGSNSILLPMEKSNNDSSNFSGLFRSVPLFRAHSHNDYENLNPLLSALNHGFMSIEVDVHLIEGELYVSHLRPLFLDKTKTLSNMYLIPLFEMFMQEEGRILPYTDQPITLMIDIKGQGKDTYQLLKKIIQPYQDMLTSWEENKILPSAVNIILSGNRPVEEILLDKIRYVQIDGRMEDLGKNYPVELMPIISMNFSKVCYRKFLIKKTRKEKMENLHLISNMVHAEGKRFRLWKIPENEKVWKVMLDQGVDIINADNIPMLAFFLRKQNDQKQRSLTIVQK